MANQTHLNQRLLLTWLPRDAFQVDQKVTVGIIFVVKVDGSFVSHFRVPITNSAYFAMPSALACTAFSAMIWFLNQSWMWLSMNLLVPPINLTL
ncbi:hypothetical protein D3C86_2051470 [compost metagenome]